MRQYVVVLAVISCVLTGCASASDVRADVGARAGAEPVGGDGTNADRGKKRNAGNKRGKKGAAADKRAKTDDRKGRHKRGRRRNSRSFEVQLRNVVGRIKYFSSPSTNIGCSIDARGVRCDIGKRRYDPPRKPKSCDLGYGNAFSVGSGKPEFACVSDTTLGARTKLPYGTSTRVGKYGCKSRRDGMRCYNLRTGRGFLVSRDVYEFY